MGEYSGNAPVMPPAFWQELARENPLGMTITPKQVQDWFYICKWPAYKTYDYSQHKRVITRWWAHVTEEELEASKRARGRLDGIARNQPRYWTGHEQQTFDNSTTVSLREVLKDIV